MISFVMPNYNDSDTIGEAIESIFDQDYPNIEMIVVDDGSTDDSLKVLAKKQKKFKQLKVIKGRHKGACYARNLGAKEATGKYLSFLPADAVLYPGVVRTWVNHLEDNPEYEFLYGGYRFVDSETRATVHNYMSEPFDAYFLKTANYIDGSFPLTRDLYERMGGWDTSIKSLQDWDFWLNATIEHGAKGMYLPEVFFETTMPHAGGLSDDSHRNWLARTRQIKAKYGIEDSAVCVTSKGAPFHGRAIAKILNADYKQTPEFKPHDHDLIYSIGFYPSIMDQCASSFKDHNGLRVVHWVGSDVWQIQHMSTHTKKVFLDFLKHNVDVHLTEFKFTQRELAEEGIKSKILPIPPPRFFPITELPKKFTVAIYMPGTNKDFYHPGLIDELAKKCRDVDFKVFGDMRENGIKGNVEYMGRLDADGMEELINNSSCLLRAVVHDGLSINVEEFLCAGRRVITNIPEIKYTELVELSLDSIKKKIDEIKKTKRPNQEAAKHWRSRLSHKKYRRFFDNLLEYDAKDYWEKRADNWDSKFGVKDYIEENIEPVMKELKALKPKSIIDIGCGNGVWVDVIKEQLPDVNYLGVDISSKLIKHAKRRNPIVDFKVMDIRNIDFKLTEKYDVAFMYTCMLHVPAIEMENVVNNLKKIAKKVLFIEPIKAGKVQGFRMLSEDAITEIESGNLITHPRAMNIHNYAEYFDIKKRKSLGSRELMIADL